MSWNGKDSIKVDVLKTDGTLEKGVVLSRRLREIGLVYGTFLNRWDKTGRCNPIPESLFGPATGRVYEGYKLDGVYFSSLEKISIHAGVPMRALKRKVKALGRRTFTTEEIRVVAPPPPPPPERKPGRPLKKFDPEAISHYTDPDYLPHVPHGDLAHLSNTENTGAGRGEIPGSEWICMIGRHHAINTAHVLNLPR